MGKIDIIRDMAKDSTVEKMVFKLVGSSKNRFDAPYDLVQDIYLSLLQKDDAIIQDLYNKGELGFYVLRMVRNQLFSVNSPYYYTYIKFFNNSETLESAKDKFEEDRRRVC